MNMKIFGKDLSKDILLIAEIGVNHEGSLEKAKELIGLAANAGADAVKFQSYTPERFICANDAERLQRVSRFGLSEADHHELAAVAKEKNVYFFSSAISEDWVPLLAELGEAIKIASADITFEPVIRAAAATGRIVILSTGGSTIDEVDQAVEWVRDEVSEALLKDRLILLHCVSSYPAPMDEANLNSIPFMTARYPDITIGYSNHALGREVVSAAVVLGARVIEVHFTDQKDGRDFHDHKLSADADDISYFAEMLPQLARIGGTFGKKPQDCEREIIPIIRKGLIAAKDLSSGHKLISSDLNYARPSTGFPASALQDVCGRVLREPLLAGFSLMPEMLED